MNDVSPPCQGLVRSKTPFLSKGALFIGENFFRADYIAKKGQKKTLIENNQGEIKSLATTYSPTLLGAVPSAMKGLTSEFGMGSGVPPSLKSPSKTYSIKNHLIIIDA